MKKMAMKKAVHVGALRTTREMGLDTRWNDKMKLASYFIANPVSHAPFASSHKQTYFLPQPSGLGNGTSR